MTFNTVDKRGNNMKKTISTIIAIATSISLVACSSTEGEDINENVESETTMSAETSISTSTIEITGTQEADNDVSLDKTSNGINRVMDGTQVSQSAIDELGEYSDEQQIETLTLSLLDLVTNYPTKIASEANGNVLRQLLEAGNGYGKFDKESISFADQMLESDNLWSLFDSLDGKKKEELLTNMLNVAAFKKVNASNLQSNYSSIDGLDINTGNIQFNDNNTKATLLQKDLTIDGAMPIDPEEPAIEFVKKGDRWYITNYVFNVG